MRSARLILVPLLLVSVIGCSTGKTASTPPSVQPTTSQPAASSMLPSPSATPTDLVSDCLDIDQATCDKALKVVLAAVAPSGWTPTHVWLNNGLLAPMQELLFDPSANFPYSIPPDNGQWIGSAEVAFAETDQHAGMNLAAVGNNIVADLTGYAVPHRDWCSGECPGATATDGPFRLELVLPHLDWQADEPIVGGMAILSYSGSAVTAISGSGNNLINFSYAEVDGTRRLDPMPTADCMAYQLDPATPINQDLSKVVTISIQDPNPDFLRSFTADPDVRLPAGTWDITAVTFFYEGAGCTGTEHSMKATLRVIVN